MLITFVNNSLEKNLSSEKQIQKCFGNLATNIINRLSDLRVAENLAQITHLPPPRRHKLTGSWDGCWGVDLSRNYRMIIRPIGNYDLEDLTSIVSIQIVSIEDYH